MLGPQYHTATRILPELLNTSGSVDEYLDSLTLPRLFHIDQPITSYSSDPDVENIVNNYAVDSRVILPCDITTPQLMSSLNPLAKKFVPLNLKALASTPSLIKNNVNVITISTDKNTLNVNTIDRKSVV